MMKKRWPLWSFFFASINGIFLCAIAQSLSSRALAQECQHHNDPGTDSAEKFSTSAMKIGTLVLFQDLLEKYYQASFCGPEKAPNIDVGADMRAVEAEFSRYNWDPINCPEALIDFMLAKEKAGNYVGDTCIPSVVKLGQSWRFAGVLGAKIRWMKSKILSYVELSFVVRALSTNLAWDIARGAKVPAGVKQSLMDSFYEAYKDFDVYSGTLKTPDPGTALQQGAWLGDRRAFDRAKKIIDSYYSAPRYRFPEDGALQLAAFAMQSFETGKDPGLEKEKKATLDLLLNSSKTPEMIKKKLQKNN